MSKGSRQRPSAVSADVVSDNWNNIFQKKRRLEESDRLPDDPDAEFEGIDSNDVPKAEKIILNCIKEIFKKPEKVLAGTKES